MASLTADPSQQAGNRRRAVAEFRKRLNGAETEIKTLFAQLPVKTSEIGEIAINKTLYEYLLSRFQIANVKRRIADIIERWLEIPSGERGNFFNVYIDTAYNQGTVTSSLRLEMLGGQAGLPEHILSQLKPTSILGSLPYQDRLTLKLTNAFAQMQGFSQQAISDITRILTETVSNGQSPRKAQAAIKKQFKTTRARAERIARTEINRSNSLSRLELSKQVRSSLGLDVRVVHRSALLFERTRDRHADRHGNVYTIEEQMQWWDEGTNRINCLCSTSEILVAPDGKVYDSGLIKRLKKQRQQFLGR